MAPIARGWSLLQRGAWSGDRYWRSGVAGARVDPYLVWADGTGFADFLRGRARVDWIPLIVELKPGRTARDFARRMRAFSSWIRVPDFYAFPGEGLERARFCTATVGRRFFGALARAPLKDYLERFELGYPVISPAPPAGPARTFRGRGRGPVVVGILDDGLAFAHSRFRDADGRARVEYVWTQDGTSADVPGAGYGTELSKAAIDRCLAQSLRAGLVDEEQVYRLAGYSEVRRRIAHGTHVMDLACGERPAEVDGDTPRIVCVQLPGRPNRGGTPLAVHLLDGLRYLLERADRIAHRAGKAASPVVANLSYANIAGPHDGSSILERAIDELAELRAAAGFSVVLPTGNSHLSRCHASFRLRAGAALDLAWRILPDCRTPSFLEIWLPSGASAQAVEIQVTPPGAGRSPLIAHGQAHTWRAGRDVLCTAVRLERVANGDRHMILVAVAPTLSTGFSPRETAPSGSWAVRVRNRGAKRLGIDAWIQRNDPPFAGLPYGRQSRFEDPRYQRFDGAGRERVEDDARSIVRRAGSINGIATGARTIVLGALRRSDGTAAPYSAAAGGSVRRGRDAMAAGDDSPAKRGVRAAGTRSRSSVAMNGTSVAAPQATRWIAAEMSAGRRGDRAAVRAEARRNGGRIRVPPVVEDR